ncbi:MAG: hypothetical protein ACTSRP_21630 [Candidatus Helarchaeota archaeon]
MFAYALNINKNTLLKSIETQLKEYEIVVDVKAKSTYDSRK